MTSASTLNDDNPLVSVIIPHYDRPQRLLETLESVKRQTYQNWEIVIVDDASPNDPSDILAPALRDERIKLLRLDRNAGPSAARNAGVGQARGRFVAFLDSDDLWEPGKLAAQLEAMFACKRPDRVICTTQILKVGPGDRIELAPLRPVADGEGFGEYIIVNGGLTQTSSVMLERRTAIEIGFDVNLRQFEDYLFFIRAGAHKLEHVLVESPLVTWFNDKRENRLSKSDHNNAANMRRFLKEVDGLIDSRTRLCFLTRHAGLVFVRDRPVLGVVYLIKSASLGLVTWRFAVSIAANALAPWTWMERLRNLRRAARERF